MKNYKVIEKIAKEKGLENTISINLGDLMSIAEEAKCDLGDVMYWFRFVRRVNCND